MVLQRRSPNEDYIEVSRLGQSDYFGKWNILNYGGALLQDRDGYLLSIFLIHKAASWLYPLLRHRTQPDLLLMSLTRPCPIPCFRNWRENAYKILVQWFLVLFGWASICYDWFVSQSKLMLVHLNDPRRFCTESLFLEWEILFLPVKQEHKTSCTFWVLHCALKKCSSTYKGL